MEQRQLEIVRECRTWVGTPWIHQGRTKRAGCDCIGLAVAAAYAARVVTPAMEASLPTNYSRIPHNNAFKRFMETYLDRVPRGEEQVGDLVLIAWGTYPMHVGVLTDWKGHGGSGEPFGVIHAMIELGEVQEQPFDRRRYRVVGYYRFKEPS